MGTHILLYFVWLAGGISFGFYCYSDDTLFFIPAGMCQRHTYTSICNDTEIQPPHPHIHWNINRWVFFMNFYTFPKRWQLIQFHSWIPQNCLPLHTCVYACVSDGNSLKLCYRIIIHMIVCFRFFETDPFPLYLSPVFRSALNKK